MSINYQDKFRFATTPRTGTTWFLQACEAAGLGAGFKAHVHQPFDEKDKGAFKVSLVRHPYYWLVSYYHAILPGVTGILEVDKLHCDVVNFREFINHYLQTCPGQVGRIFASYGADSCLRLEDMPWAACELFASLDIPSHLRNQCKYIDPVNVSKKHIVRDLTVYHSIMEAEKEMAESYDYY